MHLRTSEEEASAAKKLKKTEKWLATGFITADEAEGLKTDALNECYQDQITLDQDKVTSELSKCSDMQSMLSSLNDMCPDIGSTASHLYDSGASDETITAAVANYYGMTADEFNSKVSGKTGGSGETAAQNSGQSAQEQAAQTGTQSSGKADWLMTDGGNFSCNGKTYNPSTADEISNSKYAITAEGEIYKNVNDGSGDFMNMETGELHTAQELADATSLGMSATITAQFEALKAQQESNPDAIRCTHVEESEYPDTVLDTTTTSSKYITQQKKILQAIKDSGLSYQEAQDAINGIDAYSDDYYEEIRDVQQKGEDSKHYSEAIEKMGEDIERYIEEAPKWTGSPLFRGICCSKGTFDYIVDCVKNGLEISQNGMSSWSSGENVAERFSLNKMYKGDRYPVIFEMKKGTKQGTSICHMSYFGHSEDEVLVSNRQRVKATGKSYYKKVKKGGKSYKVLCIQVEEV